MSSFNEMFNSLSFWNSLGMHVDTGKITRRLLEITSIYSLQFNCIHLHKLELLLHFNFESSQSCNKQV